MTLSLSHEAGSEQKLQNEYGIIYISRAKRYTMVGANGDDFVALYEDSSWGNWVLPLCTVRSFPVTKLEIPVADT